MKFTETTVSGAYLIEVNRIGDERGFFGRLWCEKEMQEMGLIADIKQINVGFSPQQGTLRGLHYQQHPHREVKIVRCTRGAVYDVVLDLRPDSTTYKQWHGVELNADNGAMLYVPEGCATGYLTLCDNAEIYYLTSEFYSPDAATGVRYDDPAFGIAWPAAASVVSENDQTWENFDG
ncbi:MAG: dTDP-4-dehydrorhamnose 3,5-epimerase [Gammaproteobacteria bacterium]|nr:dTDP-4-dehydrorhamnose 3,5-epimerase [Gammaproteobacteria bacterium]